jgi:hypothetical protein
LSKQPPIDPIEATSPGALAGWVSTQGVNCTP